MTSRYMTNDFSPLLCLDDGECQLKEALEAIVARMPPRGQYSGDKLSGLWRGPTGIAYLFLHVSSLRPHLKVARHHALTWAKRYMAGERGQMRLGSAGCGIGCEKLAYEAVQACINKDLGHVRAFVSLVPLVLEGEQYPDEMLYGRAGTLYMLRMIRYWASNSASLVEPYIQSVADKILADGPNWKWHGKQYLGTVHGEIGIVTQLVLTIPSLARHLEGKLAQVLDMQLPDGNWPSSVGKEGYSLVQFCHGAPGFLHSLASLGPFFPLLRQRIDGAVERGRECTWKEGLLRKEPSICHGIFGNALVLSSGPQREHFLALATPEKVSSTRKQDKTMLEPADYGRDYATISGYLFSAAWAWMIFETETPKVIFYNDV